MPDDDIACRCILTTRLSIKAEINLGLVKMIDYYRILKVSPKATAAEIKSSYRRLARKMHPDLNGGSEYNSQDFAKITKAYQTLSDPQERRRYDHQRLRDEHNPNDWVGTSDNQYARRLRQMATQRRMDAAVDRYFERERRETMELQQTVFPLVALFLSTFFVSMLKPQFWATSGLFGKSVLLTLFCVSLWHLFGRLKISFARYTYNAPPLHDSVLRDFDDEKPFSRGTAVWFLVLGITISVGVGYAAGRYLEYIILNMNRNLFSQTLQIELVFYPPIAVMLVDAVHYFISKADL